MGPIVPRANALTTELHLAPYSPKAAEVYLHRNQVLSLNILIKDRVIVTIIRGARCSSVVRAFAHGAMGRRIDPSWDRSFMGWNHWAISRPSQCPTTGVTKG